MHTVLQVFYSCTVNWSTVRTEEFNSRRARESLFLAPASHAQKKRNKKIKHSATPTARMVYGRVGTRGYMGNRESDVRAKLPRHFDGSLSLIDTTTRVLKRFLLKPKD